MSDAPTPVPTTAPRETTLCACGHLVAIHTDALGEDDPAQCGVEGCDCYHIRPVTAAVPETCYCESCLHGFPCAMPAAPLPTAPEPTPGLAQAADDYRWAMENFQPRTDPNRAKLDIIARYVGALEAALAKPSPTAPAVVTPGLDALLTEYADTIWATVAEGYGCEVAAWPTHKVASATTDAEAWARTAIEAHVADLEAHALANYKLYVRETDTTSRYIHTTAELRSTLSQVEGERDEQASQVKGMFQLANKHSDRAAALRDTVADLEARVAALTGEKDEAVRVANHHCHVIQELQARVEGLADLDALHLAADWHEDDGVVLWWVAEGELGEPPYVGTMLDEGFDEAIYPRWSRLHVPAALGSSRRGASHE